MPEPWLSADEPKRSTPNFRDKDAATQRLVNEALDVLSGLGVPLTDLSPRRLEKMAMAFLAVLGVTASKGWRSAADRDSGRSVTTREVIAFINDSFGESISPGAYDDIRRKDLLLPVEAGIVVPTRPDAARNAPSRGYALEPELGEVVRAFGTDEFDSRLAAAMDGREALAERLAATRALTRVPIAVGEGAELEFGPGEHNQLIKAVIEDFLPLYGRGARVLYVADAEDRRGFQDEAELERLRFFALEHGELPDVVAYSEEKNWLYVIEAVHSAGPISPIRHARLRDLLADAAAQAVFVTAFLDRRAFRRFVAEIAWETEVWIAAEPEHLIHFDGERFLGPYDA